MPDTPPVPRPRGPRPRATGATESTGTPRAPRSPSEAARQAAARGAEDNGGISGNGGADVGVDPSATAKPRATRKPAKPALQAKLEQFFAIPAMAFAAGGDTYSAQILSERGPIVAEAWYELSKENATVRRILNNLVEGSAWGGVIFSTMSVILPIAKHKGLYRGPDPFQAILGGPTPPAPSNGNTNGTPRPMTWSRDPSGPAPSEYVPPFAGVSQSINPLSGDDDSIPVYQEGAPPGVVTVASGTAQHVA